MQAYHTPLFDRIPAEKRDRVLEVATEEFASLGYATANINVIAKKLDISVGSLYKYFGTKENLFLATVGRCEARLEAALRHIFESPDSLPGKLRAVLRALQAHSRQEPAMVRLYNEITTEGNVELVRRLSSELESLSALTYTRILAEAREAGLIRPDQDLRILAFCLDSIFLSLQFGYANAYYGQRMRTYLGEDIFERDEELVEAVLAFFQDGLAAGRPWPTR